jgi:hypothetical protein
MFSTHSVGGWVSPTAILGKEKVKNLLPLPGIKPKIVQPAAYSLYYTIIRLIKTNESKQRQEMLKREMILERQCE